MAELNIVLFNVDSSDKNETNETKGEVKKPVRAEERKKCMTFVLDAVKEKYPKQSSTQLFVLCQDKVNGPKHKLVCKALRNRKKRPPLNPEAVVFYRPEQQGYRVTYIDIAVLHGLNKQISTGGVTVDLARLMACVLTPYKRCLASVKVLLVSWHGPASRTADDTKQSASFHILVQFLERLRAAFLCGVAIVGGDFNWPAVKAQKKLDELRKLPAPPQPVWTSGGRLVVSRQQDVPVDGEVLADYKPTPDREGAGVIDYIVYWPRGRCQSGKTSVLCPDYRREKPRPFDHNIIGYSLFVQ